MARAGLADAVGVDPTRRRAGVMNLFTYGRSVTHTMQTMKNVDNAFEAWWTPYQAKIGSDPLMKFFNSQRNALLKEGELVTVNSTFIKHLDGAMIAAINQHAPPGTVGTLFGDQLGGNGWEVAMPDGSTQKVYFALPADFGVESTLHFPDPPAVHDGKPVVDTSIGNVGGLFIDSLSKIVDEFIERFGF